MNKYARLFVYYLPQFHPIPENDAWWGKGFTEWTNVAKAKPLFQGHYQPHIPADLGFYDLRVPEVRLAQAEMARNCGIEGFAYWHYWFAGKRLLERPFQEVLATGEPNFPFCLAWANQSWTGIWHNSPNRILVEQTYPGRCDFEAHFYAVLPALSDHRYMTIQGRPIFVVFEPESIPDTNRFTDLWRELALKVGLSGLYFIGNANPGWKPQQWGFDASTLSRVGSIFDAAEKHNQRLAIKLLEHSLRGELYPRVGRRDQSLMVYPYNDAIAHATPPLTTDSTQFPCVIPCWDNTPRSGVRGKVLHDSTPEFFRQHLRRAVAQVVDREYDERVVFVKSWNEWAEGNYLEPDQRFGHGYLEAIRAEIFLTERMVDGSLLQMKTEQALHTRPLRRMTGRDDPQEIWWRGPGHLRVAFFPNWRSNPYLELLERGLEEIGVRVVPIDVDRPLRRWVREHRNSVDVLHFHWLQFMYQRDTHFRSVVAALKFTAQLIYARLLGYRIVWTMHNLYPHERPYPYLDHMIRHIMLRVARAVVVHCKDAESILAKDFGRREGVYVAPLGSYSKVHWTELTQAQARERLGIPQDALVFLALGQIRAYKGIEHLVQTFSDLEGRNLNLVIAGGMPDGYLFDAGVARLLETDSRINAHVGWVSNEELPVYYRAADVAVCPFERVLTSSSVMEALSLGRPVVAPTIGCLPELLTAETSILYDPSEPNGLRDALIRCNSRDLKTMGENALRHAETFTWITTARNVLKAYTE